MMQVINEGHRDYLQFLNASETAKECQYRPSNYILRLEMEDGLLLCNTLTGALIILTEEEKRCFEDLPALYSPLLHDMIRKRFVVRDSLLEAAGSEQLRSLLLRRMASKKIYSSYFVLPTTYCNARCFYCYENNIRHIHMNSEVASDLVKFIATNSGNYHVTLHWFGGEPLLGTERIDQICSCLREKGVDFHSKMTSNSYLFDQALAAKAKKEWNLHHIQVTLDGTEDVYNQTKAYVHTLDNPFKRVIHNISYLLDEEIYVDIRLNLDSHNADDLLVLIDEIAKEFSERHYLSVYVRQLNEGKGFQPIKHTKEELDDLSDQLIRIQEKLEYYGWKQYRMVDLPSLQVTTCVADNPAALQCTPDGILSKCGEQIFDHVVGNLREGIINQSEQRYWQERKNDPDCEKCLLFPGCERLLKNCPGITTKCSEYDKSRRILRYQEIMLDEYKKWKTDRS